MTKYWAAEYLRQHSSQCWSGLVLGWFRTELSLAAVSLEDLGLEAVVKVRQPYLQLVLARVVGRVRRVVYHPGPCSRSAS